MISLALISANAHKPNGSSSSSSSSDNIENTNTNNNTTNLMLWAIFNNNRQLEMDENNPNIG